VVEQPHPSFYAIDVQLNGSGSVTCKIKVDGKTISAAHASGTDHLIGYVSGTTL